ncbi:putative subtilisin-like protease YSP3 [Saccharomyces paradoxus]|uniref:Subtilisin-like protease YSP3 n=1 Tax=Saccharomyces paradoxus TaxID=27291 RepID=A0A8B8UZF9_SACPA|nr:Ysp3 [Saccharomyces paradoxus]QHS76122.1 Ysp3 [Saccharomyces paradoxus]
MKLSPILPILLASFSLCMIIPELDGIVRFIETIDGTRSARAGEGLVQQDAENFHIGEQHLAHKIEFLPYRYIIVFNEDILLQPIQSHMQMVQKEHSISVSKLTEDDVFWGMISSSASSESQVGGIDNSFDINGLFRGYTGYFTDEIIEMISQDPVVKFIEQESKVKISNSSLQEEAPWGLHRVSHREKAKYGQDLEYLYEDAAGKGVTSYVLDTGIDIEHEDFEGRAVWGAVIPGNDEASDLNGHGTHCAGIIGSKHFGVAKNTKMVAVKVLRSNGEGTVSDVIKGIEYVTKEHVESSKKKSKEFKGSTANLSLGSSKSLAMEMAVNAAADSGVHFAIAAGNEDEDACLSSPAGAEKSITVGASTFSDDRAFFSNWGTCVDVFAPGINIMSTYIGSRNATLSLSGTSMAAPHVAGILSYFLSLQPASDSEFFNNALSPQELKEKVLKFSTQGVLGDIGDDTPNMLIYNGGGKKLDDFW